MKWRAKLVVLFIGLQGVGPDAAAEAGKGIKDSDIVLLLLTVAAIYFLGSLLLAQLVFRVANRISRQPRKRIWGTYGMSLLGTLLGFTSLRNGFVDDRSLLLIVVLSCLVFAFAGWAVSAKAVPSEED